MKKNLMVFAITFILIFTVLNYRFIFAQINYWFYETSDSQAKSTENSATHQLGLLPLSGQKSASARLGLNLTLEIPSLGVSAPIVQEPSTNPDRIFARLEEGVVHYAQTPAPGERGVSIILGHSSAYPWYKGQYGSVFALLGKLTPGQKFYINRNGNILVYEVKESLIFNPFALEDRLARMEKTNSSSIILVSCWPIGTNHKRIAVKADLMR